MHTPNMAAGNADYIHASILFADIENSVVLSSALAPPDYDALVNAFQHCMGQLVEHWREQGLPIGEVQISGDQLAIFFYHRGEVDRNLLLNGDALSEQERREAKLHAREENEQLVFSALKAAIQLKNLWLIQDFNLKRVQLRREPLGLGIGIHYGRVYLRKRFDGQARIEGFTINMAKRIEGYSRQGKFSQIMLSQEAHDRLRGTIVKHTQLRQRIFFHRHEVGLELLKGITEAQALFELKFFSLIGIRVPESAIEQYESLFHLNRQNTWAYYQLFEYYAYAMSDWDRVIRLAMEALLAHPHDEKILLDMSRYYARVGGLRLAQETAEQALALNPDFDLVYEHLAVLAQQRKDVDAQLKYLVKAVCLSPGSPINHMNLALGLCEKGEPIEAVTHLKVALQGYPQFLDSPALVDELRTRWANGQLTGDLPRALVDIFDQPEAGDSAD